MQTAATIPTVPQLPITSTDPAGITKRSSVAKTPLPVQRHYRDGTFEAECLPHRRELYATALRMTGEPADAHDLVQDTMLRAYTGWSRFLPGTNCRAWLFRILLNAFINIYRKRCRMYRFASQHPDDAAVAMYGDVEARVPSPEAVLVAGSLGDEVTAALDTLGAEYRQIVEMADLRGIRYREIADTLGLPIGTVMSRLFRARRRLAVQLSDFAATDYGIRRDA